MIDASALLWRLLFLVLLPFELDEAFELVEQTLVAPAHLVDEEG